MWGRLGNRPLTLVAAAAAVLAVAACADDPIPKGRSLVEPPAAQPIGAAELAGDRTLAPAVRAITDFGYRLYQQSSPASRNAVLSPLSIVTAFGMARAGANGTTAAEIDATFGFPPAGPHAALNKLIRAIDTGTGTPPKPAKRKPGEEPRPPVVSIANGLFVQNGFPLKDPFTHVVGEEYLAQAQGVDFTGPEATRVINGWVRQQTADRIDKLFDSLDASTRLVLANAVYLKADWKVPFGKTPTMDKPFTRADGSQVQASMMREAGHFRYASGDGWQAVELPYAGDTLAMWIMVPKAGTPPTGLLAPATLAAVAAGLQPSAVDVSLPRWDFGAKLDLTEQLTRLGMRATFASGGDFSGIADGVFLSDAIHRAAITVDEWGTEAAAVTGGAFAASASTPPALTVRADHPFAFAIVHTATNTPLFIGHVADPTAR